MNRESDDPDAALLEAALLDCYGRFITLLPEHVLTDHIHLPFHLQEAFWWYCDKWQVRHEALPAFSFQEFLEYICRDCPILKRFVTPSDVAEMLANWREYARKIPVRGGIIFNVACEKVLLVQSYRSKSWSFPRGKRDEAEDDVKCAAREIQEETGLDLSGRINADFYLEIVENEVNLKLFLIPGVDDRQALRSVSNYEICRFRWVHLRQLENPHYLRFATFQVRPFIRKVLEFSRSFQGGRYASQFPAAYALYQRLSDTNQVTFGSPPPAGWSAPSAPGEIGTMGPIQPTGGGEQVTGQPTQGASQPSTGTGAAQSATGPSNTAGPPTTASLGSAGWSPEEMFRVNFEKFGVVSTYSEEAAGPEPIFQRWTPVEIRPRGRRYRERDLEPFDPSAFMPE